MTHKYGPEITAEIAGHLASGLNRTDSVILADIHYDTFCEWMKHHAEFSEAIKKAEIFFKQTHINRIAKAGETTWQASAWILERKFPEEFALKQREFERADKEPSEKMAERAANLLAKLETQRVGTNGKQPIHD